MAPPRRFGVDITKAALLYGRPSVTPIPPARPGRREILRKEVKVTMHCSLCNEAFGQADIEVGEIIQLGDEFWHSECYSEYFEEALEPA